MKIFLWKPLVVNDCSKDDTEDAVHKFSSSHPDVEIAYYRHDVNKGKGAALHTGIKMQRVTTS